MSTPDPGSRGTDDGAAPAAASLRGRRIVLVVAVLASFVAFLDGSIVTVALPAIARELGGGGAIAGTGADGADLALQQWVVDAYLLALGSLMLVAGSLSDTFGRVRVLRAGLIAFAVTSVLAALAPDPGLLIAARALQGVAAALLVPSSLALITSTFSGPAQGRAIGSWTAWTGVAFLIGPLTGGALVDTVGWRWVFGVVVVPVVLTLLLMTRLPGDAHRGSAGAPARIDVTGAVLAAVGLAGPVFALIEGQRIGFGAWFVVTPLVGGLIALAAFVWWERRAPAPMMPLTLFRTRAFTVGNLATVGVYAALNLGTLTIPLVVQELAGLPATLAGLVTLPTTIVSLLFSTLFGTLAARHGPRLFMTAGPLITAGGFLWMLLVRDPIDVWWQIVPGVVLFGFGLSVTVAPLTSTVLSRIPTAQSGIASAVNNAISRVAGLVAVAFLGVITGGALTVGGFHRVVIVVAVLLGASALVSFVGLRGRARAS
ncbi:MFS transporter [Frigoribacterium faeni]|uniref:EmrB/QacA subfamily drug resistance transporter n=1 Tax=Frigoribacterium faeni TaxID=145483 RepID=A0A7W3JI39_9MICO|nr:MFS transporter [Frigoribacterium faeni]MBA8813290.1 EmrB/QacA subfamily drug resistance transporter [Frigoribacterium faeni]GEK84611.1 MFS transporter [Frigoribacterium faeni]